MACVDLHPILIIITLSTISSSAENEKNVCKTPDCYISSEMLKMSMNLTANPCHNFYEYACGNFPSYKKGKYKVDEEYDWFTELENDLTTRLNEFMNSTDTAAYDLKALKKMQLFHKSCWNTTYMESVAVETTKKIMSELGLQYVGFKNTLTGYKFDRFRGIAKIKRIFGIDFLFMPEIVRDEETNTTRLQISNPDSCIPPFLETRSRSDRASPNVEVFKSEEFKKYAMSISKIFLGMYEKPAPILTHTSKSTAEISIENMANFIVERSEICGISSVRNFLTQFFEDPDPTYEKMTLKSLKEKTKNASSADDGNNLLFDWETYLNVLFEGVDGVNVTDELELHVDKYVFKQVIALLNETSTKTLALALWFEAFTFILPFTTSELRELDYNVKKDLDMKPTTWDEDICSDLLKKIFGFVTMYHFINEPNYKGGKERADQMFEDLKYALNEVISKSEWIDKQTRVEAEKKISQMSALISHPPWLSNSTLLDSYYEDYKIGENFLLTWIGILQEDVRKNLAPIKELTLSRYFKNTIDRAEVMNPMEVNAGYVLRRNLLEIPFGIMHRPFFGHPLGALNYGGLGTIIGHEVTHGFDTSGIEHDEKGEKRNWWKEETMKKYKENTKCFENAYNNISIKLTTENGSVLMPMNDGERTLDENIADSGGVREALTAYRKCVSTYGEEPFLVGFENFSHEQLFTLSFANHWCSHSPLAAFTPNNHAQNEARVNGVFMNSEEMSQIWNCPKGSPMNPEKKCRIW